MYIYAKTEYMIIYYMDVYEMTLKTNIFGVKLQQLVN